MILKFYETNGKPQGIDVANARRYVRDGWVPAPKTVLKGRTKKITSKLVPAKISPKNIQQALQDQLIASMGRLKGQPRTVMLSGGFDSMLLVLLARHCGASVSAMTVQFEDFNLKTVSKAVLLAKRMGLPHRVVRISMKEFLISVRSSVRIMPEPLLDLDLALVDATFKKCGSHEKTEVFISGMGSDEWFGDIAKERIDFQQKLDKSVLHKIAHEKVAALHGNRFVIPFLSEGMMALSTQLKPQMKRNKSLLRRLESGADWMPSQSALRELQVPMMARRYVVKAYGRHAWPDPILKSNATTVGEQMLRQIVLGLWLESAGLSPRNM